MKKEVSDEVMFEYIYYSLNFDANVRKELIQMWIRTKYKVPINWKAIENYDLKLIKKREEEPEEEKENKFLKINRDFICIDCSSPFSRFTYFTKLKSCRCEPCLKKHNKEISEKHFKLKKIKEQNKNKL